LIFLFEIDFCNLADVMKLVNKITASFLAIVFLLSSLGFTINKMSCLKTGTSKLSLVALEDCCTKKEKASEVNCCDEETLEPTIDLTTISKADCCDIVNTSFDLSDFQTSKSHSLPLAQALEMVMHPTPINSICAAHSLKTIFNYPPPNLHGRALLSQISILII
jgi:hypothetical protein